MAEAAKTAKAIIENIPSQQGLRLVRIVHVVGRDENRKHPITTRIKTLLLLFLGRLDTNRKHPITTRIKTKPYFQCLSQNLIENIPSQQGLSQVTGCVPVFLL